MNEGFQILFLGILFQRLNHKNTKFCTKNQVLLFLVASTRKSKNHFFNQKLVKNRILSNIIKSKILIWNFYVT